MGSGASGEVGGGASGGARIDVVIPVHDRKRLVGRAVASVLAQAGCDVRVWVVDDASTDGTVEVIAGIAAADERVRLLRHEANRGVSAARNTGIAAALAAGAGLLLLLDSDDYVVSGELRPLWEALAAQPDAACAHGNRVHVPADAGRAGGVGEQCVAAGEDGKWAEATQIGAGAVVEGMFLSGMLVRASTFGLIGMFDESMRVAEDLAWMALLGDAGLAVVGVPEVTLVRTLGEDNLTAVAEDMRRARLAWVRSRLSRPE